MYPYSDDQWRVSQTDLRLLQVKSGSFCERIHLRKKRTSRTILLNQKYRVVMNLELHRFREIVFEKEVMERDIPM